MGAVPHSSSDDNSLFVPLPSPVDVPSTGAVARALHVLHRCNLHTPFPASLVIFSQRAECRFART